MHQAYLIGISDYPGHPLAGVPNDLALMRRALLQQAFDPSAIRTFGDEHGTLAALHDVLATIQADFASLAFAHTRCHRHKGTLIGNMLGRGGAPKNNPGVFRRFRDCFQVSCDSRQRMPTTRGSTT